MTSLFSHRINSARRVVWPFLRDAWAGKPRLERRQMVADVIWELARADLLVTPEMRAVLDAAEEWLYDEAKPAEDKLADAVEAYIDSKEETA